MESSLIELLSTEYIHNAIDSDENMPNLFEESPYYNDNEAIELLKHKHNAFSILSLNCQSLQAKFDQLKIYVETFVNSLCPFSIIALQETWLTENHDISLLQLEGYTLLHKPKSCSAHGGVALYLRGNHEYKTLTINSESNTWDGIFVEVVLNCSNFRNTQKIVIGNIYRPPRETVASYELFSNEIQTVMNAHLGSYREVVLTGDFNLDLLKIGQSAKINDFFETMTSNGYLAKIVLPTRITNTSATLFDNCFVKLSNNFSKTTAGILNYNISDHQPYFITLDYLITKSENSKYIKIFVNNEQAKESFKNEILINCTPDKFQSIVNQDPNITYDILDSIIQNSLNKHLPHKLVKYDKYRHKKEHWITQGIIRSIRFRDKLYCKLRSTAVYSPLYNKYKVNLQTYNRILRNNIKLAKKKYYYDCFEKFKNDMKNTWTTIKNMVNRTQQKDDYPKYFLVNELPEYNQKIIADNFNKFFIDIGLKLANTITPPKNKSYKDYLVNTIHTTFKFNCVKEDCVKKTIDILKPKSSSGIDRISNKLVKLIKDEISGPLTIIVNQIIKTGIFPQKLKVAKVIPFFKKGENYLFDNYRPVSLLPSLSKVIEKIMFNQLYEYFNENNLFFDSQYGFRKQHSTELAALELINNIVTKMDLNEIPLNIYLDLSKAFDTLNHDILLDKLNHYGVLDNSLLLLKSYLSDRQQYVEFGEVISDFRLIETGVPQGSILGPLLFIIYMNDIVYACKKFKPIIYADDTALSATLNSFYNNNQNYVSEINNELTSVNDWFQLNGLSININKTKAMLFYDPRKKVEEIKLKINNSDIEFVTEFNYLGIIFDSNLSWNAHINMISRKISKSLCVMNKLKNVIPTNIRLTLYNTLILPHINYGILAWGSRCHKLFKLQKRSIRQIANVKYNAHTDPIFKQLSLLKISNLCVLQELKFIFKLKNKLLPNYYLDLEYLRHSDIHSYDTRYANRLIPLGPI